jgi:protein-L-isoaspartate(D-aspartate) O-methyltransferase
MIEQQVRTWSVFDTGVLNAFADVSRTHYVPQEFSHCAYADDEIPIGNGQVMLRPSLDGRILESVDIQAGESVLEIGTGSGYLTACIARLAGAVTSVDLYDAFLDVANEKLRKDGVDNASLSQMDASTEVPDGEFDVVIVSASVPAPDERFAALLRSGGRLFVVLGESPAMTATLVTRTNEGELSSTGLFETNIPPLIKATERPPFSF